MILRKSFGQLTPRTLTSSDAQPPSATDMANGTNASSLYYSYEYYMDYLDLIPVDEKKLTANKHSIVIAFWLSLAAFVVLLFLILLYMSCSGSLQGRTHIEVKPTSTSKSYLGDKLMKSPFSSALLRNNGQQHPTCSWSHGLHLPFFIRRFLLHHRAPRATLQASPSSVKEPGSTAYGPHHPLQQEGPSTSPPTPSHAQAQPALSGELALDGDPHGIS